MSLIENIKGQGNDIFTRAWTSNPSSSYVSSSHPSLGPRWTQKHEMNVCELKTLFTKLRLWGTSNNRWAKMEFCTSRQSSHVPCGSWLKVRIRDGWSLATPKRMNFRKNSKRPLSPPSFLEIYIENVSKNPCLKPCINYKGPTSAI